MFYTTKQPTTTFTATTIRQLYTLCIYVCRYLQMNMNIFANSICINVRMNDLKKKEINFLFMWEQTIVCIEVVHVLTVLPQ